MLSAASFSARRSLTASVRPAWRAVSHVQRPQLASKLCTVSRRPQVLAMTKPLAAQTFQLVRHESRTPIGHIDHKAEEKASHKTLKASSDVSTSSSIHPVLGEVGQTGEERRDTEMLAGVKSDVQTIRDTFSLEGVPKEAYYIGLAGVIPYVVTSLGTYWCAFEIHQNHATGTGYLISDKTAELLLHVLEPLQIGYGATIISFLGAIHWGLEFSKYGGEHGYSRYMIGMFAAGAAWPTILLPVEYALISQFLIFNFLYYTDSRATKRGWAPPWYAVYRFVLTFIVGSSIVVSLIGRGQIADRIGRPPGTADRIQKLRDSQAYEHENEEEARRKYLADKDEEGDEEEEQEGGGDDKGGDEEEE